MITVVSYATQAVKKPVFISFLNVLSVNNVGAPYHTHKLESESPSS